MKKHQFFNKSFTIKLSAIILPIALIAALVIGLTTSAMVNIEPVSDEIQLELLGQGEQSVYVIHDTGNGFRRGEKLTWASAETLGRVSINGQVMNTWVTLRNCSIIT